MARQFGCARATVNRALRQLAEEGLLERRRKGGTRVALNPVRKATFDIPIIRHEIESRGGVYSYAVLSRTLMNAPKRIETLMKIQNGEKLFRIKTLHRSGGTSFMYEDRWINPVSVENIEAVNFETVNANEWLLRHAHYTSGDLSFSAENATKIDAKILNVAPGTALFVLNRVTWNGAQSVTAVRLAYGPNFSLQTHI